MQADQHNYQPDEQFTNKGWSEMLKNLDKEMPVQEKKRRGFFWLFPFLLVGVIISFWVFYPSDTINRITQTQFITSYKKQVFKSSIENTETKENQNNPSLNQIPFIENKKDFNNKVEINDGYPSIIDSSNLFLPRVVEEEVSVEKTESIQEKDPITDLKIEVVPIDPVFITIKLQEVEELMMEEGDFYFEEEIIEIKEQQKRKIEFGVFAGVVGDFANMSKQGLMTGTIIHFPFGKKLGFKIGLGYSQLSKNQPYYFTGNQNASLSSEFIDASIASPPPFSTVAIKISGDFILEKFHQLDLPVLLTYSPIKKLEFHLGANSSYLIKDQAMLFNNNLSINESVNNDYSAYGIELDDLDLNTISQNQYEAKSYWTKLNVSAVVGLVWKPNLRINLGLQYHHGILPILKSNNNSNYADILNSSTVQSFEVFNNSGGFNSMMQTSNSNVESIRQPLFNNQKFIKYNNSIRFSIGYTF